MTYRQLFFTLTTSCLLLTACTGPKGTIIFDTAKDRSAAQAAQIAADPVSYMRSIAARCADQPAYEVEFYRQERVGLFIKSLNDLQHSRVKFQADPLRIRMDMLDEDSEFLAVTYIDGKNDNKLRCQWRRGAFGGEGAINDYDTDFAVKFGRSQSPITEFGVARLVARILKTHDEMIAKGTPPIVEYVGVTHVEHTGLEAHHIRLTYDQSTGLKRNKVDLLIDSETELPAACYLWLADDVLDAQYLYSDFKLLDSIALEEFLIESTG